MITTTIKPVQWSLTSHWLAMTTMVTNIIITIKPTQQSLTLHGLVATIIITTNIIIIIKPM